MRNSPGTRRWHSNRSYPEIYDFRATMVADLKERRAEIEAKEQKETPICHASMNEPPKVIDRDMPE